MAFFPSGSARLKLARPHYKRGALAFVLMTCALLSSLAATNFALAANNSVQGAKKEEGGLDLDAPTAILIEANSGSVLFEKNADQLLPPSSMMKLMTAEVVFRALTKGDIKLTDEFRISENAWRRGARHRAARPCSRPSTAASA